ncbi:MAG TPA: Snf7 family protein [Planctomycetota bacterium]|nr:Snf7 family protein [Planctomycetota bacterium]
MGMFKSKEEKRIERDIEVRKGVNSLKRNIRDLAKHELSYIQKAKKAKRIGDNSQYDFLKRQLKKTAGQRRMRERQLLSIETAVQIKNQAESDADFAKSMGAVAKAVSEVYGSVDFAKTQKNFEKAMMQADTLQQQMEIFLEMTQEHVMSGEVEGEDQVVTDAEIDKMLDEEVVHEEGGSLDKDIEKGLKDIADELDRER